MKAAPSFRLGPPLLVFSRGGTRGFSLVSIRLFFSPQFFPFLSLVSLGLYAIPE